MHARGAHVTRVSHSPNQPAHEIILALLRKACLLSRRAEDDTQRALTKVHIMTIFGTLVVITAISSLISFDLAALTST
jgi:hypothetical protein